MLFEILFQFLLYKNGRRSCAARFFLRLLLQPLQPTRLQLVIPAQERIQLLRDLVHAARVPAGAEAVQAGVCEGVKQFNKRIWS